MADLPAEVVYYCARCHQKLTKENCNLVDCPFCLTCHIIGAIASLTQKIRWLEWLDLTGNSMYTCLARRKHWTT